MPKLTLQEEAERKAKRQRQAEEFKAEEKQLRKDFPSGSFEFKTNQKDGRFTRYHLYLVEGETHTLRLGSYDRTNGKDEVCRLDLKENLQSTADFIRALTIRYNAMVRELNAVAGTTPTLAAIDDIDTEAPICRPPSPS